MKVRGLRYITTSATISLIPFAAAAQTGMVTTAPIAGAAAPAVGLPLLVLSALALGAFAIFAMRRRSLVATIGSAAFAVAAALAAVTYAADADVIVSGAECNIETTQPFASSFMLQLISECANNLRIVAIDAGGCGSPEMTPPACVPGDILPAGGTCNLPFCE
jgi:hypothetical protein